MKVVIEVFTAAASQNALLGFGRVFSYAIAYFLRLYAIADITYLYANTYID